MTETSMAHLEPNSAYAADTSSIGPTIAHHRQLLGWTQRELGEQLGIGTSLIAKWEQGIRVPPHEWMVELDQALGSALSAQHPLGRRRRGPRPAAGRAAGVRRTASAAAAPVLVELSHEGVRVYQGEHELETVVVDLRAIDAAPGTERVRQISELLLRSLDLPRPVADRLVRRLADPS